MACSGGDEIGLHRFEQSLFLADGHLYLAFDNYAALVKRVVVGSAFLVG